MLDPTHWKAFEENIKTNQPPVGTKPLDFAKIAGISCDSLPDKMLRRNEVLEFCQNIDADVWLGFVCAMAWGGQDKGPGGHKKVLAMFKNKELILEKIQRTKLGGSRKELFEYWRNEPITQLGPAYFTKVLFFFSPPKAACYIMDQWTANSVNLLMNQRMIRACHLDNHSRCEDAGEIYSRYCDIVDDIKNRLNPQSGSEAETALFSVGGKGKALGAWRKYVKENIHALKVY